MRAIIEYNENYWKCGCEGRIERYIHANINSHCALCGRNKTESRDAETAEVYVFLFMMKLNRKNK